MQQGKDQTINVIDDHDLDDDEKVIMMMMMMIMMNLDDDGPLCSDITQTVD
jgi:hypothetical protein